MILHILNHTRRTHEISGNLGLTDIVVATKVTNALPAAFERVATGVVLKRWRRR